MKIKVKDIEFNPFRNTTLVPIDVVTVEKLKGSITDLGLWAGMTARPKNNDQSSGKYQIPFGHHRLVAIRELGIKEIDISVNEISDFNMVLMMVQENMTQRGVSVEMINGTVREVKEFLDSEIMMYESWERVNELIKSLFESPESFSKTKQTGVGQTTILKFLKGSIPQWRIASALDIINSEDIDTEAVNSLKTTGQVEGFKKSIRKINKERQEKGHAPIDFEKQKELAGTITNTSFAGKTGGGNYYKSMEDVIRQNVDGTDEFETAFNSVARKLSSIQEETRKLSTKIAELNGMLNGLGVTEVKSLSSMISMNEFTQLLTTIGTLAGYMGIKINNKN